MFRNPSLPFFTLKRAGNDREVELNRHRHCVHCMYARRSFIVLTLSVKLKMMEHKILAWN